MNLIPKPNGKITPQGCELDLSEGLLLNAGSFLPDCAESFYERSGLNSETGPELELMREPGFAPEEYYLAVNTNGIRISASSERGVVWALATVYQAMENGKVPCFTLRESPRYRHRGIMLDVCRHFFSADEVKKLLDEFSLLKINTMHWHLTEDQGWRIESKLYPELHKTSAQYYTQDEIRDVVSYAEKRGIEIIPEVDMPGHMLAAIAAYPHLSCRGKQYSPAKGGGIIKIILCAGKESTFDLLLPVVDEICSLFPSKYFHIGGDEAPKLEWKSCPDCNARLNELGLDSLEDLQGWFTSRVTERLERNGKTAICWNDCLHAKKLPEKLRVQYWLEQQKDGKTQKFLDAGGEVVFSEMYHNYFDYPHSMIPLRRVYNCAPAIDGVSCPDADNVLGVEACVWTERIDTNELLEHRIFPRAFAISEVGWTRETNYEDFEARAGKMVSALRSRGINCAGIDEANIKGDARREEMLSYLDKFFSMENDPEIMATWDEVTEEGEKETDSGDDNEGMMPFLNGFEVMDEIEALKGLFAKLWGDK